MNSENNKTSDPRRLLLNLTDKIDLRIKDKSIAFSKSHVRIINLEHLLQH